MLLQNWLLYNRIGATLANSAQYGEVFMITTIPLKPTLSVYIRCFPICHSDGPYHIMG